MAKILSHFRKNKKLFENYFFKQKSRFSALL